MRRSRTCESGRTLPVPQPLRDASYKGAKRLGHGQGYQYAHDHPGHFVAQDYLGADQRYYEPTEEGVEKKIKERLEKWRAQLAQAKSPSRAEMNPKLRPPSKRCGGQVAAVLRAMTPAEREAASGQARELLASRPEWRAARSVLFYAPLAEELDVWPLVREALGAGKRVGLPRFAPESGAYMACEVQDLAWTSRRGISASASRRTIVPPFH